MSSSTAFIRQTSFASGELSPKLKARSELQEYKRGVKKMRNMYTLAHGGAKRRPGLAFVGEVRNSAKEAYLMRFVYSKTLSYVLVLNDGYFQFIRTSEFITSGSPKTRVEVAHPYAEDELFDVTYTQIGSQLYLCHPNHSPRVLSRSSDTSWQFEKVNFTFNAVSDSQWYRTAYLDFKVLEGSTVHVVGDSFAIDGATGAVTSSGNTGNGTIYGASDGVALIKKAYGGGSPAPDWTVECIYADSDRKQWSVYTAGSPTYEPIGTWEEAVGSPQTNHYPAAIGLYEQRLWFGGTPSDPQRIWFSGVGDYQNLTPGTADNDGNYITIASGQFDQILHIEGGKRLVPLTFGSEFSVIGGEEQGITPSTIKVTEQTRHGTSNVKPVRVGPDILFVQRGGKKVRSISYNLAEEINQAPDITILAEHVTGDGLTQLSFAQDPDFLVWATRTDGKFISLTLIREFGTEAWAIHETDGSVETVCTIPNVTIDQTYMVVNRSIGGQTKRYIEFLDYIDGAQTDSAKFALAGSPEAQVFSGFDHLEGETVTVVADGSDIGDHVVTGGVITVADPAAVIEVGLNYTSRLTLLHPEEQLRDGTSQGRVTKVSDINIDFFETNGGVFVGLEDLDGVIANADEFIFMKDGQELDAAIESFTGKDSKKLRGWSDELTVAIEQRKAYSMTILGSTLRTTITDMA